MDVARALIREPDVSNATVYRRRVGRLAGIYVSMWAFSVLGIGLLLWNGRLLVTLAQRSNVETLVIAFFLLFFGYLALLSSRGALGGLRILAGRCRRSLGGKARPERRPAGTGSGPAVALNRALERAEHPGEPFELELGDAEGGVGRLRMDGVKISHVGAPGHGSNDMLAFFVRQVADVLAIDPDELDVVSWRSIDQEGWHQYVGLVDALRALGRRTGGGTHLWPHLTLTRQHCAELARRMEEICGSIREEALLPQREYEGEHKIPIVPEPLGILSLGRRERRVDPLSSMGSSLAVVVAVVGVLVWFVTRPPWVPGG
jgi:hypothetical protein